MTLNFGKHYGEDIQDITLTYLRWTEKNLTRLPSETKSAIAREITRRTGKTKAQREKADPKVSPTNGLSYPYCLKTQTLRKEYERALKQTKGRVGASVHVRRSEFGGLYIHTTEPGEGLFESGTFFFPVYEFTWR